MIIQDLRAFSNGVCKKAMPVLVFTLLFVTSLVNKVVAQADSNRIDFHKGSFFDFYLGTQYNNSFDLQKTLLLSDMWDPRGVGGITPKFPNQRYGQSLGISGFYGLDRGVLIGGSFNYVYLGRNSNVYAKTNLSITGISFNMGKVVYNFNNVLMHIYVGVGFSEYLMRITNKDRVIPVKFDALPNAQLDHGKIGYYHATIPIIEVAYGIRYRIKDRVTLGLTAGIYFSSTTQGTWATGGIMGFGQQLEMREGPTMNGGFMRLSVELWRKGTKIYAGPRAFVFDSIAYKRELFVEDSTAKAIAAAKKGVVFENKYKRELDIKDSIMNAKGFLARIKPVGAYDTSSKAMAKGGGGAMPQPVAVSGPAMRYIPLTTNIVKLNSNAKKATLASTSKSDKKQSANSNSQSFNFNRVLETSKADTTKRKPAVKPVVNPTAKADTTKSVAKDSAAGKQEKITTKKPKSMVKTRSTSAIVDSLIKATADKASGKDTLTSNKKPAGSITTSKPVAAKDTVAFKKQVKQKPILVKTQPAPIDTARIKARKLADLKKRSDIIKKYTRDSLFRVLKQSQAELEEKYRRGLIKNDSTNKVVRLIKQSKNHPQQAPAEPDSVITPPAKKPKADSKKK